MKIALDPKAGRVRFVVQVDGAGRVGTADFIDEHDAEERRRDLMRHFCIARVVCATYPAAMGVVVGSNEDCFSLLRYDLG
jgi:hypothetical protein